MAVLSAVPCRPTALLVRLTFKESWDADNNPTTSCCEKTFRMVAECFDTALVILAGVALRKHTHTHTQPRAQAITVTYHLNTVLFIYSRIFHYYCHGTAVFQLGIKRVFVWKFGLFGALCCHFHSCIWFHHLGLFLKELKKKKKKKKIKKCVTLAWQGQEKKKAQYFWRKGYFIESALLS